MNLKHFTVTLGDGWRSVVEQEIDSIVNLVHGPTRTVGSETRATEWRAFIIVPEEMSPEEAWVGLRSTPGFIPAEDEEVIIAGITAKQFDAAPETEGKSLESSQYMLIYMEAPADQFEAFASEANRVTQSLQFGR